MAYLGVGLLLGVTPARLPRRRSGPGLRTWLWQAGLSIHPASWIALSLCAGLGAGYAGAAVSGSRVMGAVLGVAAAAVPSWVAARRRVRRLGEAARAWPDALRFLAASLRSGRTLPGALEDLPSEGPEALRPAFGRFASLAQVFGTKVALEIIRGELADPLSDRVIEVIITAFERGGDLVPGVLQDMADSTTEDLRTAEEIDTNSLEQRLNARVVIVIPWLVLMMLTARQGPFREFYSSPAGTTVILVAGALSFIGLLLLARFGRTATEPRLVESRR
jgi:tight adherence protein B